jgi:phage terminase small subunit
MKGRKPLQDKDKEIKGTLRADRVNDEAPTGTQLAEIPKPPKDITGNILQIWNDTADYLFQNNLLSPEVVPLLIAYCCEWKRYYEKLNGDKETYTCLSTIMRLASEMGITPASRSKVKTNKKNKQQNELDFLNIE